MKRFLTQIIVLILLSSQKDRVSEIQDKPVANTVDLFVFKNQPNPVTVCCYGNIQTKELE